MKSYGDHLSWLVNALWSYCGRYPDEISEKNIDGDRLKNNLKCNKSIQLNMPDTILFRDGIPHKWIQSDKNGFIVQRPIQILNYRQNVDHQLFNELIENIATIFTAFTKKVNNFNKDNSNTKVCVAWYADGSQETFTDEQFRYVLSLREWLEQVAVLQAFIASSRPNCVGSYYKNNKIRPCNKTLSEGISKMEQQQDLVFDGMTKSVAIFAQAAYCNNIQSDRARNNEFNSKKNVAPHKNSFCGISIEELVLEFKIDDRNKLWISHPKSLVISYSNEEKNERSRSVTEDSAHHEAETAARTLKLLIQVGIEREISIRTSFSHFDMKRNRFVDTDDLRVGLSRLGIIISFRASEILMGMIGTVTSSYFRESDLEKFVLNDESVASTQRLENNGFKNHNYNINDFSNKMIDDPPHFDSNDTDEKLSSPKALNKQDVDIKDIEIPLFDDINFGNERKNAALSKIRFGQKKVKLDKDSQQLYDRTDSNSCRVENKYAASDSPPFLVQDESIVNGCPVKYTILKGRRDSMKSYNVELESFLNNLEVKEALKFKSFKAKSPEPNLSIFQGKIQLLVIPDIFMPVESLFSLANVLNDSSSALIIKLPGLLRYASNKDNINILLQLLRNLDSTHKWQLDSNTDLFWLGFGIGSTILLEYFTDDNKYEQFSNQSSMAILVNPFIRLHDDSAKNLRKLRNSISSKEFSNENRRIILNLLYSQDYLQNLGEKGAWEDLVTEIQLLDPYLYKNIAMGACPSEEKGILSNLLKCVADDTGIDHTRKQKVNLPIYLLLSTEDKLVDSTEFVLFLRQSLSRQTKNSHHLFSKQNIYHVRWMNGGHNLFHEKHAEILNLYQEVFDTRRKINFTNHLKSIQNLDVPSTSVETEQNKIQQNEGKPKSSPKNRNGSQDAQIRFDVPDKSNVFGEYSEKLAETVFLIQEKEKTQTILEQKREEIHRMRSEDIFSFQLQKDLKERHIYNEVCERRREIVSILRVKSEEQARREIELNSLRSFTFKRWENQPRQTCTGTKGIEAVGLSTEKFRSLIKSSLVDLASYNVKVLKGKIEKCSEDLKYTFEQLRISSQYQRVVSNEASQIRHEYKKAENKAKSCRQALKLLRTQHLVISMEEDTLDETKRQVRETSREAEDFFSLYSEKRNNLRKRDQVVQYTLLFLEEKRQCFQQILSALSSSVSVCKNKMDGMQHMRQDAMAKRINIEEKISRLESRIECLSKTGAELCSNNNKSFVDTDLWQGICQRMPVEKLEECIRVETDAKKKQVKISRAELETTTGILQAVEKDVTNLDKLYHTLQSLCSETMKSFSFVSKPFDQHTPNRLSPAISKKPSTVAKSKNLIDIVRGKEENERDTEESTIVSIDQVLFPSYYPNKEDDGNPLLLANPRFDIGLEKIRIQKMFKLPEPIQFALPFILDIKELKCHMLINRYYRGFDDAYYKNLDRSNDIRYDLHSLEHFMSYNMEIKMNSAKQLFSLCNACLMNSAPYNSLSSRQKHWLKIKKIIQPKTKISNDSVNETWGPKDHNVASLQKLAKLPFSEIKNDLDRYIFSLINEYSNADEVEIDDLNATNVKVINVAEACGSFVSNKEVVDLGVLGTLQIESHPSRNSKLDPYIGLVKEILFQKDDIQIDDPVDVYKSNQANDVLISGICSLEGITNNYDSFQQKIYVESENEKCLSMGQSHFLQRGKVGIHRFFIHNPTFTKLASIRFVVVFQGEISNTEYVPGRISASLGILSENQLIRSFDLSDVKLNAVGYTPYSLQSLNSKKNIGQLVILHEPSSGIDSGIFELALHAESMTKYSINVIGKSAVTIEKEIFKEVCRLVENNKLCEDYEESIRCLGDDIRVTERKIQILKKLIREAEEEGKRCEYDIEQCENEIEEREFDKCRDIINQKYNSLRMLETEFNHWCHILSSRNNENDEALESIDRMAFDRRRFFEKIERLKNENKSLGQSLLMAVSIVFGNAKAEEIGMLLDFKNGLACSREDSLASTTRSKPSSTFSSEEVDFAFIDKILFPNLWTNKKISQTNISQGHHFLHLDKQCLVRIWEMKQYEMRTRDELKIKTLLLRFYGKCDFRSLCSRKRASNFEKDLQSPAYNEEQEETIEKEDDTTKVRCRIILRELDRVMNSQATHTETSLLHASPQYFSSDTAKINLQFEMDKLIKRNIFLRESKHKPLSGDDDKKSDFYENDLDDFIPADQLSKIKEAENRISKSIQHLSKNIRYGSKYLIEQKSLDSIVKEETAKVLGPGFCLACKGGKCEWRSVTDIVKLDIRLGQLSKEMLRVQKSTDLTFRTKILVHATSDQAEHARDDILKMIVKEIKEIKDEKTLSLVDKDLHDAYATSNIFFKISSLHRYTSLLPTTEATIILEREHNKLVASSVSTEVVNDVLDWMLDGWYFGECDIKTNSLNRQSDSDPWISTKVDGSRTIKSNRFHVSNLSNDLRDNFYCAQTSPKRENEEHNGRVLDKSETSLKFGLFCITFMYFRALHLMKQEKSVWCDQNNIAGQEKKGNLSEERKKMLKETSNVQDRLYMINHYMSKAKIGAERLKQKKESKLLERSRQLRNRKLIEKRERVAALIIQRYYRGNLGRKGARLWKAKMNDLMALNALTTGCAVAISRVWRGFVGRKYASKCRKEMAEYILSLRQTEAEKEEKEYWDSHAIERWKNYVQTS